METARKRVLSVLVTLVLAIGMFAGLQMTAWAANENDNNTCEISGTQYSLTGALSAVQSGQTIKLLESIDSTTAISISQNITIDLNGHNLTIDGGSGTAINITGVGGSLTVTDGIGGGTFSVIGDITSDNSGIRADGATVTVDGDITANGASGVGVWAEDGATVEVTGNVSGAGSGFALANHGVFCTGDGSQVIVYGDVTATRGNGVWAEDGATVEITGNVKGAGSGSGGASHGVSCRGDGSQVIVYGDVESVPTSAVACDTEGKVYVTGTLTYGGSEKAIWVGSQKFDVGSPTSTGHDEHNYTWDVYTDGTSYVYLAPSGPGPTPKPKTTSSRRSGSSTTAPGAASAIGPALTHISGGTFRANGVESLTTPVWAEIDGEAVPSKHLDVNGNTVTISDAHLAAFAPGEYRLALHMGDLVSYVMFRIGGGVAAPLEDDAYNPGQTYNPSTGR